MAKKSSREHIVAVATALFARRGLSVSLREINDAAGLSAAAVHYHFKNKNALLDAVLRSRLRSRESIRGPSASPASSAPTGCGSTC